MVKYKVMKSIMAVSLSLAVVVEVFGGNLYQVNGETNTMYVDSKVGVEVQKKVTVSSYRVNDNALNLEKSIVSENAGSYVSDLYAYLETLGTTDAVIYGHQNDTIHKSGTTGIDLTSSDTLDITGSLSGIVGIDTLALTGSEYTSTNMSQAKRMEICTNIAKEASDQGAIINLGAHMPNFAVINERITNTEVRIENSAEAGYLSDNTINFSGDTSTILTGNVVERIVPGGDLNNIYNSYLDMIAAYAKECAKYNIPILFQPFEENTGSTYWWGAPFCDSQEFVTLYRYTVDYLQDKKHVNNMLYVYSPGCEAELRSEYANRYPGDDYVDIVGFEMYDNSSVKIDKFLSNLKNQVILVGNFAKEHNKVFAVTGLGITYDFDADASVYRQDWYTKVLDIVAVSDASYMYLCENSADNQTFSTPYVMAKNANGTLHGHKMLDGFINFYNDSRTIFAKQMGDYKALETTVIPNEKRGYFYSPLSGTSITKPTVISAYVDVKEPAEVVYCRIIDPNDNSIKYYEDITKEPGTNLKEGKVDIAITEDILKTVGKHSVTLTLVIVNKDICSINLKFNMETVAQDVFSVDNFEGYEGENYQLTENWIPIKAAANSSNSELNSEKGYFNSETGNYGVALHTSLLEGGYCGIIKNLKGVDWSSKNAIQFFTKPDGKKQDVLIRIITNQDVFEVNLNDYKEYSGQNNAMIVTIPFSALKGRENKDAIFDSSNLACFEILVKANGSSLYPLISTNYYDDIKAIKSEVTEVTFLKK